MSSVSLLYFLIKITYKIAGKQKAEILFSYLSKGEQFFHITSLYDFEQKRTNKRLILMLPGKGCAWYRKTGGCTMCGFNRKLEQIGRKFSDNDLIALYKASKILTIDEKPTSLAIYNAGSFINDEEISEMVQGVICQEVKKHPTIKSLLIESRTEYINEEKLLDLKKKLGDKNMIMAIGLEAQDDKIRNVYIKKGLAKIDYESAIKILKKNGVRIATYLLIKPIYLNEREAINEAVKSAEYAFGAGSDEVLFESSFIQKGTFMEKLYNENKFKPPWLWSIIEVIKKTHDLGNVRLGGFEDEPPPIAIPSNCDSCSERIRALMKQYRQTNNIKLFDNLYCGCKEEWKKVVKP